LADAEEVPLNTTLDIPVLVPFLDIRQKQFITQVKCLQGKQLPPVLVLEITISAVDIEPGRHVHNAARHAESPAVYVVVRPKRERIWINKVQVGAPTIALAAGRHRCKPTPEERFGHDGLSITVRPLLIPDTSSDPHSIEFIRITEGNVPEIVFTPRRREGEACEGWGNVPDQVAPVAVANVRICLRKDPIPAQADKGAA